MIAAKPMRVSWDKALPTNCGDPEHPTTRIQREPIKFDRRASSLFVFTTRSAATQYHQILQYIELVQRHVNITYSNGIHFLSNKVYNGGEACGRGRETKVQFGVAL